MINHEGREEHEGFLSFAGGGFSWGGNWEPQIDADERRLTDLCSLRILKSDDFEMIQLSLTEIVSMNRICVHLRQSAVGMKNYPNRPAKSS
ncbi:hypothetical protein [Roseibacillus persicicus]|uniref:hypothetical protein n=1 Tax=Roseibacillus persicicus TaxID=454148 RepID=UPI001675214B|nr:hypothetical protein [Roseibacillus persicicus]